MTIKDISQVQKAEVIISHYFKLYNFFKKYVIFAIGVFIGITIFLYFLLRPETKAIDEADIKDGIGYIKLPDGIRGHSVYVADGQTNIGDFSGSVIGDYFIQKDGNSYSRGNLLYYENIPLPYDFISAKSSDYLGENEVDRVADYIKYFIDYNDKDFNELNMSGSIVSLPQVNYKKQFNLGCMDSKFKIFNAFCDYNLEYFATNLYKYDVSHDFNTILDIFNKTEKEHIRNYICTSISNYEMLTRNIDSRFDQIFNMCDTKFKTTHNILVKFNSLSKQLDTQLDTTLDTDRNFDLYKLVSAMGRIQQQINNNTIELGLLNTYQEFVSNLVRSSVALDQFYIDLIYRYHNQQLLPGLEKLQTKVNLTTVQDIKNISNKIDLLNYSDGQGYAGLYNLVTRSVIMDSDFAVQNGGLGSLTAIDTSSQDSDKIAGNIIDTITNIIDNGIDNNGSDNSNPSVPTNSIDITDNQSITPDINNDLNTYRPSSSNTYNPSNNNQQDNILKSIQSRFLNYLGITPISATASNNRYYVVRDHDGFDFGGFVDMSDDWEVSPIHVKIDGVMTLIPGLEMHLMDYDRYTQIKFLKNTADYVRSANQNQ